MNAVEATVSIQAVAWALEQDFSYTTPKGHVRCCHAAKLVLISLANHADHTNGHCWPSAETIAKEANCAVKTVYRLVAALARNGFVDVKKTRGDDGKQRSNNYWIIFDRPPAEWKFYAGDESDDDEPGNPEPGDTATPGENASQNPDRLPGPGNDEVTRHIMLEPLVVEPSMGLVEGEAQPPPSKPKGFDPKAREREWQRIKAAEEARRREQRIPVIRGTEPWNAWVARGHPNSLFTKIQMPDGRRDFGWYFTTLWPPPQSESATSEPKKLNTG